MVSNIKAVCTASTLPKPSKVKPSTNWFFRAPLPDQFPDLSGGRLISIGVGALGVMDLFRQFFSKKEEPSFWGFIIRPLLYAVTTVTGWQFTKPPKDQFAVDVVNNTLEEIFKSLRETLGSNKSLIKILSKDLINPLRKAATRFYEQSLNILKKVLLEYKESNPDTDTTKDGIEQYIDDLSTQIELYGASKDISINNLSVVFQERKRLAQKFFTRLFRDEDSQDSMSQLIQVLNTALKPNKLHIFEAKYNPESRKVQLKVIVTKPFQKDDKKSPLYMLGFTVSMNPENLLSLSKRIVDDVDRIKNRRSSKEILQNPSRASKGQFQNLNKTILNEIIRPTIEDLLNLTRGSIVELDTKTNSLTFNDVSIRQYLSVSTDIELGKLLEALGENFEKSTISNFRNTRREREGREAETVGAPEDYEDFEDVVLRQQDDDVIKKLKPESKRVGYTEKYGPITPALEKLGILLKENEDTPLTELKVNLILALDEAKLKPILEGYQRHTKRRYLALKAIEPKLEEKKKEIRAKIIQDRIENNLVIEDEIIGTEITEKIESAERDLFKTAYDSVSEEELSKLPDMPLSRTDRDDAFDMWSTLVHHDKTLESLELILPDFKGPFPEKSKLPKAKKRRDVRSQAYTIKQSLAEYKNIKSFLAIALENIFKNSKRIYRINKDGDFEYLKGDSWRKPDSVLLYALLAESQGGTPASATKYLQKKLFQNLDEPHRTSLLKQAEKLEAILRQRIEEHRIPLSDQDSNPPSEGISSPSKKPAAESQN